MDGIRPQDRGFRPGTALCALTGPHTVAHRIASDSRGSHLSSEGGSTCERD